MLPATPTVVASLARACLNSVPLNKTAAIALVTAMEPYLEWQSDSAYLRDPPETYFYPPHDIFAYLASVKTNLESDKYANEYEFQEDLYQVFARAHDGHFVFYPDALTKAIEWGRQRSLVSISEDGTSLPVIKLYEDVVSGANASVVTEINGEDAATYVANFAYTASFNQDADAAYNTMFFEKAFVGGGTGTGYFNGGGRVRYIYPGDNTTFTFANGSSLTLENVGHVKGDFSGVTDGSSFYTKFCIPESSGDAAAANSDETDAFVPDVLVPGYPSPVVITNDTIVSGYYLNGADYEDVAVLSLLAFESESPLEFQQVTQQFFADAVRDGKTKLVIDLSANGGGYILQGYDEFRQLFPDIVQDGNSRWRENPTFLAISEVFSSISASFNPLTSSNFVINEAESVFNYRYDLNISNEPFLTFEDKFAPHVYKGDNFTNLMRWNLNDPLTTSNDTYGLGTDITGYRSRTNFTQPFEADNIIMLLDGYCASTCTLFTEFMRTQAGIKSIAMGGRPMEGPIQGVGGIKGAQILGWGDIYSAAQTALLNATAEQAAILSTLSPLPASRALSTGINVRDNILPDHVEDGLPGQFVFEEADCRLYYTEPMVTDVTALWKAAADAAFGGASCNYGSLAKRDEVKRDPKSRDALIKRAEHPRRAIITEENQAWVARHGRKAIP
ncbi:uncharacterized protein LY89DRAFT_592412 [Mollisia scopiformis]|uniref:CPAF-like PDZ domain-containing protein n=1 Tax=Mollisia scopiformis TaxID=149040 RepID=A0A194WYS2_MOLSC|nr:uncharacterized protein LY89DRAFT_592412 [Mollisia scopiformis]KUJ13113.1 hypothetical protein LY89DRAFT_592412 [Mollisia scopiformis]